jgi:hypothetical protein
VALRTQEGALLLMATALAAAAKAHTLLLLPLGRRHHDVLLRW